MGDSLAGVALGAGSGERLRPLSLLRPKVLCPVGDDPLIDHAIGRLSSVVDDVAVNVHESQPALIRHLDHRVHLSLEQGEALGTAGGVANLRGWLDGRAVAVVNGDTWCPGGLEHLVDGWDGSTIRILVAGDEPFGPRAAVAASLMPWDVVERLPVTPSGLWEVCWRQALEEGRIETVHHHGPFVDCADAVDYLRANLASAGGSVVGKGAVVEGAIEESVVWPGARVREREHLVRAIRTDAGTTVLVRRDVSMRLDHDHRH
ncbi:NTP transferase domain-containing protein [Acidimicrobiia bacterium EGI L10123]|uniref:nucleotidyltransferase family protein n=1 Tax=Salinilacustrithrix flava TaxID=2957203 RepID=UPI003D7C19B8|nr:NTP transferase domain-containing protein [Acidimicrobiia bacterium EGI L10123]